MKIVRLKKETSALSILNYTHLRDTFGTHFWKLWWKVFDKKSISVNINKVKNNLTYELYLHMENVKRGNEK